MCDIQGECCGDIAGFTFEESSSECLGRIKKTAKLLNLMQTNIQIITSPDLVVDRGFEDQWKQTWQHLYHPCVVATFYVVWKSWRSHFMPLQETCFEILSTVFGQGTCKSTPGCNYYTFNADGGYCGLQETCEVINAHTCQTCLSG
jgi:ribosomal protein L11 methylase PrmA